MEREAASFIRFVRVDERAFCPDRGSSEAAGFDIKSPEEATMRARSRTLLSTGLKMAFPPGSYGRLASRSGLSAARGIEVGAGVVDSDYRGVVSVLLYNHSDEDFFVRRGDKIAQVIPEKIVVGEFMEATCLERSERGDGGFGSTGR